MPKAKYKFNPDTLNYEQVEINLKALFSKIVLFFVISLIFSAFMSFIFLEFLDSPKAQSMQRENNRLLTQYRVMDKKLQGIQKVLSDLQQRDDNLYRVVFDADPIPNSIRKAGFGGADKYAQLESFDNAQLVVNTARKLDIISKEAYVQSKSYDQLLTLARNKEKMLACIPAIMPISNKDLRHTASGWGFRIHPIYKIKLFHYGMDFSAPIGTPIYSTGDGVVESIRTSHTGFGRWIIINHGFGYETLYGHLSAFNVKKGQKVKRGSVIGFVGNAGTSTGPHVHYEVHKNGKPVNPQYYYFKDLSPKGYDRMVAISSNAGQSYD